MIKKFFATLWTIFYSCFLLGSAFVAWDFVQHWKSAEGDYGVGQYVDYVSDRYGDDVKLYSDTALGIAQTSFASAKALADSTGVTEMVGELVGATDAGAGGTGLAAPEVQTEILLASTNEIAAPEASLLPKARAVTPTIVEN